MIFLRIRQLQLVHGPSCRTSRPSIVIQDLLLLGSVTTLRVNNLHGSITVHLIEVLSYSIKTQLFVQLRPQVNAPLFFIAAATLSATSPTCFLYATFQVQRIPLRNSSTTVQELRYFIRRTHPSAPCCRSTRCCRRGATTRCSPLLLLRIPVHIFLLRSATESSRSDDNFSTTAR